METFKIRKLNKTKISLGKQDTLMIDAHKLHGIHNQTVFAGTSLVVQRLRLRASTAGGTGSIPGRGTKIPHAAWRGQKKNMFAVNVLIVRDFTCLMHFGPERSWHKFPLERADVLNRMNDERLKPEEFGQYTGPPGTDRSH